MTVLRVGTEMEALGLNGIDEGKCGKGAGNSREKDMEIRVRMKSWKDES